MTVRWTPWIYRETADGVRLRGRLKDLEVIREAVLEAPASPKRAAALGILDPLIGRARREEDSLRKLEERRRQRAEEQRRLEAEEQRRRNEEWWRRLYDAQAATQSGLDVLGLAWPATTEQIKAAYREKAKLLHPDAGGDQERFVELQRAYEAALRRRGDE
jgi:hypothetical protein